MKPEIQQAIEEIRSAFPGVSLDIEPDPEGGAFVTANDFPLGPQYEPERSWCGFRITFQYPFADISRRLNPKPPRVSGVSDEAFHRQSLMFGAAGQHHLANAKVGIIGLGGVGSLVNEYVARLGVGEIVAVDYDRIEHSNRPRVTGSRVSDCRVRLRGPLFQWLRGRGACRTELLSA